MHRVPFATAVALLLASAAPLLAQTAQPAAASTSGSAAPAAKARFVTPIKGPATVDVLPGASKRVGKDIVTTFKIKNTSNAPIALLRLDEYWYDKSGKLVSSDTQRHRQPLAPGEIVELTTRAPDMPGAVNAQRTFAHAHGTVKANAVKKME